MIEKIEEELKKYYDFLTIEVEYVEFQTYKIYISVNLLDYIESEVVKGVEFKYKWVGNLTISSNIEQIKYKIEKAIIKFFRKEIL